MRFFKNPYQDHGGGAVEVDSAKIKQLIEVYVQRFVEEDGKQADGDLYVGSSGIAFMFLKLHQSQAVESFNSSALSHAKRFIDHSKRHLHKKPEDFTSFLCGNAGITSVSAVINFNLYNVAEFRQDREQFLAGYPPCREINLNRHGSDEILFGRAGYLSGIYWLNQCLPAEHRITPDIISNICDVMIESGVQYSKSRRLQIPMMWECYGDKYLGAAHGISAILHMMLESPMFGGNLQQLNSQQQLVKTTIDMFLGMQAADGNFPSVLEDAGKADHKLVHWCHGAPGVVYLFAKAFIVFKEQKYLESCLKCGELVWSKGLLRKGPGICHGIAGSGYVFLLLYRLTGDHKHLHRAAKFADFLTTDQFTREANIPDRPLSLYEGFAGTVCFLIDLLEPMKASFPFMDVFDVKY